jgi:hypothetical protein
VDDVLQLGLVYHSWPFSVPPGALSAEMRAYVMARTLAALPTPQPRSESDDG